MLVDANRHEADHVLVDRGLTLKLGDHARRGIDVEQHEMRLAVALDPVGQVLEAPGLRLGNLALIGFDDACGIGGQLVDLSLAQILAREKNMLVKRHARVPFTSMPIAGLSARIAGPLRLSSTISTLAFAGERARGSGAHTDLAGECKRS